LNDAEILNLRRYLEGGGFLLADDSSADANGPFERALRRELARAFPNATLETFAMDHAVLRSFYLLRTLGGRRMARSRLKGRDLEGRTAVILASNDLHGALARDHLGNPLLPCEPGGEPQRLEGLKLLVNIVIFSVTGTYKKDAIHQPFIEKKLGI